MATGSTSHEMKWFQVQRVCTAVQTQTMASKDSKEATQNQNDQSHGIVNYGIDIDERSLKSEQNQNVALQNSKETIPNQDDKSGLFL